MCEKCAIWQLDGQRGGCITAEAAEAAFLVLDSEHDGDRVKDVNISYNDIMMTSAPRELRSQ